MRRFAPQRLIFHWEGIIFLEEGLFEQAIAIANARYCRSRTGLQVMQAVIKTNSQWVIEKAKSLAEEVIMIGRI